LGEEGIKEGRAIWIFIKATPGAFFLRMEPLLPYFLLLCEFFNLCNFDARFLRPNFQEKDKIQKKAKQKEGKI